MDDAARFQKNSDHTLVSFTVHNQHQSFFTPDTLYTPLTVFMRHKRSPFCVSSVRSFIQMNWTLCIVETIRETFGRDTS